MTDAPDPEKVTAQSHDTDATVNDSSAPAGAETESPIMEDLQETKSRASRFSHFSRNSRPNSSHSDDSDPFEALERALTPDQETEAERAAREPVSRTRTGTSVGSAASRPPEFEVSYEPDDPEDPKNWPVAYRAWVIFCVSFSTWVVVLYSTSYTASIPGLMAEYHVTSEPVVTLGVTTYLFGLAIGSLVVAPMSELYGRRPVYILCMTIFVVMIIPCGLATSLAEILVVRFFG